VHVLQADAPPTAWIPDVSVSVLSALVAAPLRREKESQMFGLSASHLLIFAIVGLLLFGNRLPSTMRSLGEGLREFKKGMNAIGDDNQ
jgi:sec-independent protein translocase protein TatA